MIQRFAIIIIALFLAACGGGETPRAVHLDIPTVAQGAGAPRYSPTPTFTMTPSPTPSPTATYTRTPTPTPSPTLSPTVTPSLTPTVPLWTLTPPPTVSGRPIPIPTADLSAAVGWSCGDFPCEDDIEGFLARIRVPQGFEVTHVGRYPGQPLQIVYGGDGRLYATVLEDGTLSGAVYALSSDGSTQRVSESFFSPIGLAFQPGTDVLYVSARVSERRGGGLWRLLPDGRREVVRDDLPCCHDIIGNQPNGLVFGPDGYLYLGVGALTDHGEPPDPENRPFADIVAEEAAILRIHPHTGETTVYARGIRNPYDLAFDAAGQLYATDNGLLAGPGDRILRVDVGAHYGWPYYRPRGCGSECPPRPPRLEIASDLLPLPDYTLPRGLVVYYGSQFPPQMNGTLFIALWHHTENAQRVIWLDPRDPTLGTEGYTPFPFITGLIRPTDVVVAEDGSLLVADFIYGHVWRVRYTGAIALSPPREPSVTAPIARTLAPDIVFATATPN